MTGPKINPNEYDDDKFGKASTELSDAVGDLWDAGATLDDIRRELESALDNIQAETA